ncbi:hypothetical protein [Methylobacterium sp. Leaf466]|uniref:hypothetical protein n=1 Tax=Methylobacterium sp. Leaf466 TaxID=1736386 RepID=UPI0006FECDF0|nr:hypothetical protein [Methylobacterium sp. Leaf466]KQT82415.1 hypothetical protein ASG59_18660 [Methylobacterium sp. Leaf466]
MTIETADWIADLDPTNPPQGDPIAEGPGHIRLIKGKLVATFPALGGPVTSTHTDLNNPLMKTPRTADGVPIYTTSGADTLVLSAFGKGLLTGTLETLATSLGTGNFALKSGGTLTGALTVPRLNVGSEAYALYVDGAGNPHLDFASGHSIVVDVANKSMNFYTNGVLQMLLTKDGDLKLRGNVTARAF